MGKIIKKSTDNVIVNKKTFSLWMKWEFKIEFANDSFWPYDYKFEREDCYFNDWLEDRWSKIFPLKNKKFNNTELFIEIDDIVVTVWKRWWLSLEEKNFIDIINIRTEKKYRLFTDEVNFIYNSTESIVINAKETETGEFKTFHLDIETMKNIEEKKETIYAFFKSFYNETINKWYLLDFNVWNPDEKDEEKKYQNWYFKLRETKLNWIPLKFNRKNFTVKTDKGIIDVWEESKS